MHTAIVQRLSTDKAAFTEWLAKLNNMNGVSAGNELYKFIIALKREADKTEPSLLRQAVMQITPVALYLSDLLEKSYIDKTAPRIAQLNIYLVRQLASLHIRSADEAEIDNKTLHYNYALQLLGLGHYLSVLSYEHPSSSVWTEMGIAYRSALDLQITESVTDDLPPALQRLNTIEKVTKRNLLFAACDAYRLSRLDIQTLFKFCNEQYEYLELNNLGNTINEGFCWPYTTRQLPFPIKTQAEGKNGLIFNTELLIKAYRGGLVHWPIPDPSPLLNALTNYKVLVPSKLMALPGNHVFISEFERVATFYNAHIRTELVWMMNSPSPEHLNFSSLEIMRDDQAKKERVSSEDIWGKPKDELLKLASTDFGAIKTTKTDTPGFFVCEAIRAELRDRDLLCLYGKDLKPYLAIVRRLEPARLANIQKALIQIIPGDVEAISILDEKIHSLALSRKHHDTTELFLSPKKYGTGSAIETNAGSVTLEKLLEITPYFMRYQVSWPNEKQQ